MKGTQSFNGERTVCSAAVLGLWANGRNLGLTSAAADVNWG